jgi:FMN-dependent oxidoreductase (nitrilotriacetate monooxygenase family)
MEKTMSQKPRQMNLNVFVHVGGHHEAAWRYPGTDTKRPLDIRAHQELAQKAEAAKFDALFFSDHPVLPENIRHSSRVRLEPLTWTAALTTRIGFISTASTTYFDPYNLARLFSSIDHLSNGRAGWNIVTTGQPDAAKNYGLREHPPHADRYQQGREFVEVVTKLWDSWEDDAIINDPISGVYADTDKIHAINHHGAHYNVRGPLTVPRSPQGRPVYVQAGSSEDGRSFAATYAEAIFTAHQTLENAQQFYADIKSRVKRLGRQPDHVKVLPGISPFIAATEAEAVAMEKEFNELTQAEFSLVNLQNRTGLDLRGYDLDAPFPRHLLPTEGDASAASRFKLILDLIDREKPTLRQLLHKLAGARGHSVVAGTPEQIADRMQTWFEQGAADGFNIMPPCFPGGFDIFAQEVVPILRARGLFRDDYEGTTLRDHYGLPRPESLYSERQRASA